MRCSVFIFLKFWNEFYEKEGNDAHFTSYWWDTHTSIRLKCNKEKFTNDIEYVLRIDEEKNCIEWETAALLS